MKFPVYFHIFGLSLHAHMVMECLGYLLGFQLYRILRKRWQHDPLPFEQNIWIIVGAAMGALAGSHILAFVESFHAYWPLRHDPRIILAGKTIVGGLAGGWIGVEIAKHSLHIARRTGDVFVYPLMLGMSLGRVGCFLTGLDDHTYGIASNLPWAVDFGDGIRRHPTQLYEIVFLILLGLALLPVVRRPHKQGIIFRLFMLGYFSWRLAVDFIKPHEARDLYFSVSPIQWTCIAVIMLVVNELIREQRCQTGLISSTN